MSQPLLKLSPGFLLKPPLDLQVRKTIINFKETPVQAYDGLYAVILDNVFSTQECQQLIRAAEATTCGQWEQAMINVGNGKQMLIPDARDCGRIIWDDRDVVARIWGRVKDNVPEITLLKDMPHVTGIGPVKRKEVLHMTRLNERMRFLKYTSGQYFRPHCDGVYVTPDGSERSQYTLHLYLNDSDDATSGVQMEGGATRFHSLSSDESKYLDVEPRTGRVLIFQHRGLLHSGDDVRNGTKYTLRTDLMYEKLAEYYM
ncbi:MAG: hypothetical protein Q9168_000204 [Polycauliona sp. 1 TL-2023]